MVVHWVCAAALAVSAEAGPMLHRIESVLRLSHEEAATRLPVHIKGVVTYADPAHHEFYLQQGDAAVAATLPEGAPALTEGDLVEFSGSTAAGDFAPRVEPTASTIRVLDRGPLPQPEPLSFLMVASGAHDARLLRVEGLVRRARLRDGRLDLSLQSAVGRVHILWRDAGPTAPELIDGAWVRVTAVFATELDTRGEMSGLRAYVGTRDALEILAPPVAKERLPQRRLDRLLHFSPNDEGMGRVRTTGTVTLVRANGAFFFEDDTMGVLAEPGERTGVRTGDRVEVIGYPALDEGITELLDAQVVRTGARPPEPPPTLRTLQDLANYAYSGRVVRLEVELVDFGTLSGGMWMSGKLRPGGGMVDARMPADVDIPSFDRGSILEWTGVRQPLVSRAFGARTPLLSMRTGDDVRMVSPPSFWNRTRVLVLLALAAVISLGWSLVSRYRLWASARAQARLEAQVALRTEELKQANQLIVDAERERTRMVAMIAHDLRSPLTVISMNAKMLHDQPAVQGKETLEPIQDIEESASRIGTMISQFLDYEVAELRRFTPRLVVVDLTEEARAAVSRLTPKARTKLQQLELKAREPAPAIADPKLLSHVVDNLIDNACKYCERETLITVEVSAAERTLVVRDRGPGMSPESVEKLFTTGTTSGPKPTAGEPSAGVGLLLIRQWVEAMGGRIECESSPGKGSLFRVRFVAPSAAEQAQEQQTGATQPA